MIIQPTHWSDFQHYKTRRPPWIKLHKAILDDYKFHCLPVASKALAPLLWLLASEFDDGIIDLSDDAITFRLRMSIGEIKKSLEPLESAGFFIVSHDASDMLAECKQVALSEEKRREEKRRGEFKNVILSEEEYLKLKETLNGSCEEMIENLSAYMKQHGKKYKSHYATLLNWYRRDKKNKPTGTNYGQY